MAKRMKLLVSVMMLLCCMVTSAVAQTVTVKGKLLDAETNEPLIGASVAVKGTTVGTVTDMDGNFSLDISASRPTLLFTYVGYKDETVEVSKTGYVNLGEILMKPDAIALGDVVITQSVAIARKTPVALSTVDPVFIEERLGTQEFPEVLKSTPGVYATKQGGGFGDSRINLRGFTTNNIADE